MIEQGFNYADSTVKKMTNFFKTRKEKLDPKQNKKSSAASKKIKEKKSSKEWKKVDYDSNAVDSSEEISLEFKSNKKYCFLHRKCSHSIDNCKDLRDMINKH